MFHSHDSAVFFDHEIDLFIRSLGQLPNSLVGQPLCWPAVSSVSPEV
jgi:hypothetical protein